MCLVYAEGQIYHKFSFLCINVLACLTYYTTNIVQNYCKYLNNYYSLKSSQQLLPQSFYLRLCYLQKK